MQQTKKRNFKVKQEVTENRGQGTQETRRTEKNPQNTALY